MTNKPSTVSFDNDFGFSFASEEELTTPHLESNEELTIKLQMMYDAIIPLLKNLNANPTQEYIKWPDRTKKIVAFKNKLDKIGGEHIKVKEL
jgi:hypothetical protein